MWWWILAAIAGIFVAGLTLGAIFGWFDENTQPTSSHGELIKKRLRDGNYKIVAGVFNKRGVRTAETAWETDELDSDLAEYFDGRNRVRVEI